MNKAVVVGYGSIGQRHARLLTQLGVPTAVVSRREIECPNHFWDLSTAVEETEPDYIIIANKTNEHYSTLEWLNQVQFRGTVLVEKPIFDKLHTFRPHPGMKIYIAYNLRFHPGLVRLKKEIQGERILSVMAYTGQYLPDWRPSRDYRESYSSKKEEGGGVLRDLSHELDYLTWLFGKWNRLSAIGGRFSNLEITGDDFWGMLIETRDCPLVTLQINYLDRPGRRELVAVTDYHTFRLDIGKGVLDIDGKINEKFDVQRDDTYLLQHRAVLDGLTGHLCSLEEGMEILRMIEVVEKSATNKEWVWNG